MATLTRHRPDVLAVPSATTSRYLVFLATLLSAGAFAGSWVHNATTGNRWLDRLVACSRQAYGDTTGLSEPGGFRERAGEERRCRDAAEYRRFAFMAAGAAATGLGGVLVMLLIPRVLERRRRLGDLLPALAGAQDRFDELARGAGVPGAPKLVLGASSQLDAFSYGRPGHYRVALPRGLAVRWSDGDLFDPVMRHELAHLRQHDVALAWLARSMWWVLIPTLAAPIIGGLTFQEPTLIPDYTWRAALLALTAQLVSSQLLRSREHDADLRAAHGDGNRSQITAVLARIRDRGGRSRLRRAFARHPAPATRLSVLEHPERTASVTHLDAFATGLLSGLVAPAIPLVLSPLLARVEQAGWATVVVALLVGPLLAGSVGLGLLRSALAGRLAPAPRAVAPAIGGVVLGFFVGHWASLANAGLGPVESLGSLWWYPAAACVLGGGVLLAYALAHLVADAAPSFPTARRAWVLMWAAGALVFATAVWLAIWLQQLDEVAGQAPRTRVFELLDSWLPILTGIVVVATALFCKLASRTPRAAPRWILDPPDTVAWPRPPHRHLSVGVMAVPLLLAAIAGATGPGPAPGRASAEPLIFPWWPEDEARVYEAVMSDLHGRWQREMREVTRITRAPPPAEQRGRDPLATGVIAALRLLVADASAYPVRSARIQEIKTLAVQAFRSSIALVELAIRDRSAPGSVDPVAAQRAVSTMDRAVRRWVETMDALPEIARGAG